MDGFVFNSTDTVLDPKWSPDKRFLAYLVTHDDNTVLGIINAELWVLDSNGDKKKYADLRFPQLAETFLPIEFQAYNHIFWSPDSSKIAYLNYRSHDDSQARNVNFDIQVLDVFTNENKTIAETTFAWDVTAFLFRPLDWSPDSTRITYTNYANLGYGLYVADVDGSLPTILVGSRFADAPQWLPDGDSIIFLDASSLERPFRSHPALIYSVKAKMTHVPGILSKVSITGDSIEQLTIDPVLEPVVSPNGDWVAYYYPDTLHIAVQSLIDNSEGLLSSACIYDGDTLYQISWSPNSERLAFRSALGPKNECMFGEFYGIVVYFPAGYEEILRMPSYFGGFAFSPDSVYIAGYSSPGGATLYGPLVFGNLYDGTIERTSWQGVFAIDW
jgi:Tol biopolymer transport system component